MSFNSEKSGQPAPKKSKNMLYNIVGGGALSAALLFGGAAWVTNGATPSYAQTSQVSTSAVDQAQTSNSQTQQTAPDQQTAPNQQANGQNQPPMRGPGGRGPAGGPGDHGGPGGPGGKGGPGDDLSGTLTSINGNVLTLKRDNAVNIVATVTSSTKYTQAGQTINQSDLKTGERLRIEETHDSSGTATITQVDVVLDHSGGAISAISSDSLTLTRPDNTTVKVVLNGSTTYYDLNNKISQGDLKSGEKVDVEGLTGSDGTLTAQVVHVHHDRTDGTVTAVNGNTITIQMGGPGGNGGPGGRGPGGPGGRPGTTNNGTNSNGSAANGSQQPANPPAPAGNAVTTITVSGSTVYNEAGQSAQLSDIKVGTHISAVGDLSSDGKSLNALQVMIQLPSYHGQVASVSGNTITVQDRNGTKTVEVNSNTKYLNGTASASLSDVKAGVNIDAQGQLDSNGKMTASVIQLGQPQGPQHP